MAQFVRPIADVDAGSWDDSSVGDNDGSHFDELVADDNSKTESDAVGNNVNTTDLDVEGTNSGIDSPGSGDQTIRVVWNSDQSRDMTGHAELWQGVPDVGTLIAEATVELVDTTEVTTTHVLTGGEAANITDYNDLHFALWGRGTGGGPARTLQVDLLEFEIPDLAVEPEFTVEVASESNVADPIDLSIEPVIAIEVADESNVTNEIEIGPILEFAEYLRQLRNYSGSGDWLDETGNGHDAEFVGPLFLPWTGQDYAQFSGISGDNVQVTLAVSTIYDYTVTYEDDTSDTGTETSDGSGVVTFGDTDVKFAGLDVATIDVVPDGGGATLALFDASLATEPFDSFTDSEAELWTINRTGTGQGFYFVKEPVAGLHTDDYFNTVDDDALDYAADESFTTLTVYRPHNVSAFQIILTKNQQEGDGTGYTLYQQSNGSVFAWLGEGPTLTFDASSTLSVRVSYVAGMRRDTSADELEVILDTPGGTPATDNTIGSLANARPLRIGATALPTPLFFLDAEIMADVMFRFVLTDTQIAEAVTQLTAPVIAQPRFIVEIAAESDTAQDSVLAAEPVIDLETGAESNVSSDLTLIAEQVLAVEAAAESDIGNDVTIIAEPVVTLESALESNAGSEITVGPEPVLAVEAAAEADTAIDITIAPDVAFSIEQPTESDVANDITLSIEPVVTVEAGAESDIATDILAQPEPVVDLEVPTESDIAVELTLETDIGGGVLSHFASMIGA